jgi:hypothetical protein
MRAILMILFFLNTTACCFAQNGNPTHSEVDLSNFGIDSLYNDQLKIKAEQGKLSDCEFGIKIANDEFNKENYIYYSKELVGPCLYCDVLRHDYNVKWRFSIDLFSDEYYSCYNEEISRLLNQKYGFDIFLKAFNKVDSLYRVDSIPISYQSPIETQYPQIYFETAYSKIASMLSGNDSLDFKECGSLNLKIK